MLDLPTDEDWIDLASLYSSSFFHEELLVIDFNWEEDEMNTEKAILFSLRTALRKVGHKITRMRSAYKKNQRIWTLYYTTITQEEGEKMRLLWNNWLTEFAEDEYYSDSDDDENVEENVMEDDNPSN